MTEKDTPKKVVDEVRRVSKPSGKYQRVFSLTEFGKKLADAILEDKSQEECIEEEKEFDEWRRGKPKPLNKSDDEYCRHGIANNIGCSECEYVLLRFKDDE